MQYINTNHNSHQLLMSVDCLINSSPNQVKILIKKYMKWQNEYSRHIANNSEMCYKRVTGVWSIYAITYLGCNRHPYDTFKLDHNHQPSFILMIEQRKIWTTQFNFKGSLEASVTGSKEEGCKGGRILLAKVKPN